MQNVILVINAGSSSIKFSLFLENLDLLYKGKIEQIQQAPKFSAEDKNKVTLTNVTLPDASYEFSLQYLLDWINKECGDIQLSAAGHRVVHGGTLFAAPTAINNGVIEQLRSLTPLAPLHQPHNLKAIEQIASKYPKLPQVACFDTAFHRTQDPLAQIFAIPRALTQEGLLRYGFHGLSYEYIATQLDEDLRASKVIVAHLGNGSSMCALKNGKSVATTMGFTALDGLMMGTRCGRIDPGVLLYLLQEKKMNSDEVTKLLYSKSGLLGVSDISSDMCVLENSKHPQAAEAIELFCYNAARELSGLCNDLDGCDAIIFTAGIGENSRLIRQKIAQRLEWLGVQIDVEANAQNSSVISTKSSKVLLAVMPTNEEYMIAKHTELLV
jgi:acetate kinase